ncbi:exopolyphosphatase [Methylocapsa palsarum]|uniref:exopolyphosphatase n=1 Tax=Methylocapsa palsarum TaxID=1612308 RepID=A0A1I3WW96_9HYPH|nr:exopolyphosphatase [Methylocapsa palsarum]SFK11784.1 exopolyphosphatase / guanosine-5'-triphosphate,3'-diphosphate pyrophosphatase [Methylocapsa palsarum]
MKQPVAIVDIGSNSVRIVVYESLTRSPRPIFNEKSLCALGNGVATTGRLSSGGVEKALAALRRFRILSAVMGVREMHVIATAAARDASNGPEFLQAAEQAINAPISLLSGDREAQLSALGVVSGIHKPDGVVGDLGGGSLELIDVKGAHLGKGSTLPLGGLTLMDASGKSPRAAVKIVRETLAKSKTVERVAGRTFYAVGGTWRALAKLHMSQRNYPLTVMHGYVIPTADAMDFAGLVERVNAEALSSIETVSAQRRPLLAYGAAVLEEIIRRAPPKEIMISSTGVREGLLYEMLAAQEQAQDPLIVAASEFNQLFARAPRHAEDLCAWTDRFVKSTQLEETIDERRLRHVACLLADVNWRAHPDYRSDESVNLVENTSFIGVDHPGRSFLALTTSYRYLGLDADVSPQIRALVSSRALDKARIVAAAIRLASTLSGAMPDVLPSTPVACLKTKLILTLPHKLADLSCDRLLNRLKQLARLIGRVPEIVITG